MIGKSSKFDLKKRKIARPKLTAGNFQLAPNARINLLAAACIDNFQLGQGLIDAGALLLQLGNRRIGSGDDVVQLLNADASGIRELELVWR